MENEWAVKQLIQIWYTEFHDTIQSGNTMQQYTRHTYTHHCSSKYCANDIVHVCSNFLKQWVQQIYRTMLPMQMYFKLRYSSMPYFDPSLPRPLCLIPPKGTTSEEMAPSFTPTIPVSKPSLTRHI